MKRIIGLLLCCAVFVSILFNITSCGTKASQCDHEWSEWEVVKEPTCSEGGYSQRYCKKCMITDRRVLYALPHPLSDEWVYDGTYHWHPAICEHKGAIGDKGLHTFENNRCTVCGAMRATQGLEYRGNLGENTYRVHGIGASLDQNIIVARYYSGCDVVAIDSEAFANIDGLLSVAMQQYITEIGPRAFAGCKDLESLEFTKNMKYIGEGILDGCESFKSIRFVGTRAEWEEVEKHPDWNVNCNGFTVICNDGTVRL